MQSARYKALLYLAPAAVLLGVFLVYPVFRTMYLSLFDSRGENFVGFDNYRYLFESPQTLVVFRNNLLWLVLFTSAVVVLGLLIAVLANHVRYEAAVKALIFVPMAVSFTATAVIWRFMYIYNAPAFTQTGVVNALMVWLGFDPVPWIMIAGLRAMARYIRSAVPEQPLEAANPPDLQAALRVALGAPASIARASKSAQRGSRRMR